jgi:hypothetical protein
MSRFWKCSAVAFLALVTWAPAASARGIFLGSPRYLGGFYGPVYYPGFFGPGRWYGPWSGQVYYPGPPVGEVQIVTKHKGDSIYVDGGLAGRTGQLKKFPLRAGAHTIELRNSSGHAFYQERITVIPGKKLKIHTDYPGQP